MPSYAVIKSLLRTRKTLYNVYPATSTNKPTEKPDAVNYNAQKLLVYFKSTEVLKVYLA